MLDWMAAHLPSPSDENAKLILTDEQALLVVAWYTVDDHGQFIYRRAILEMAKGWGKSPLVGALAIAEFAGPVLFDGWDAEGEPVGRPWGTGDAPPPLVQIAAVSEDQAENTYGAIYQMLSSRQGSVADGMGIDLGRTRLYLHGRPGILQAVTASAGSREGQRLTFAVPDETQLWTKENGGLRLAGVLRRNVAKMGGRTFETTNAPALGEKSVAERSGNDFDRGFDGILYYAKRPKIEPQPDWTDEELLASLDESYGDAYWIDKPRLVKEIRDPSMDWEDALRFFFNIRTAGGGSAVDPRRWDELAKPRDVPSGTEVGLGFDGSISDDTTVLRACTRDGYAFPIAIWRAPPGAVDWRVPHVDVDKAVSEAFARYRVGRMYCDPPKWETDIERWVERYGKDSAGEFIVRALDTNQARRFAPACSRWRTAIRDGSHTHDGDAVTTEHVKAAHLKKVRLTDPEDDGRTQYVIVKGEDRRKIDAAVADILAYEAAMTMPAIPERKPRRLASF